MLSEGGRRVHEHMFDATELREISGTAAIADASVASDDELLADTVRVGRWLKWLPELDQAAASGGTFTADHAAEVARVANLRNLDGLAELLDQDGGHDPDRDLDATTLNIIRHSDGTAHLKGQLGAADAEIVLPSLDAAAQKLRRDSQTDVNATDGAVPIPNRAQLMGQALVDRCVRADAMAPGSKPAPSATTVRISADDPNVIHNLDRWYLRPSVANELCCDTIITTVMLDSLGLPLDIGRDQRLATAPIRTAVLERDGGCRFPGCDAPPTWVMFHHIRYWDRDHGPTAISNLMCLCPRHHGVIHRNNWTVALASEATATFATPDGTVLHTKPVKPKPHPATAGPRRARIS